MGTIRAQLLGRFQLLVGDEPVIFPTAKVSELAAFLCWNKDEWVDRDEVRFELWPDAPLERASANLRQAIYLLRSTLERSGAPDTLETRRTAVRMRSTAEDRLQVGALDFMDVRSSTPPTPSAATGPMAILSATGSTEFLTGVDAVWAARGRAHFRDRYLVVMASAVRLLADTNRHDVAIVHAHRWLEADPFNEEIHRTLMRLYGSSGNPAGAIRQFDECRDVLSRELGIAPDPSTRALRDALATPAE
jgi:DNA-binding SARP family transcriptional activator